MFATSTLEKLRTTTVSKIYYIDGLDNLSCSATYHPNFSGSAAWQSTIALSVLVLRGVSVDMVPKFIIINLSKFIGKIIQFLDQSSSTQIPFYFLCVRVMVEQTLFVIYGTIYCTHKHKTLLVKSKTIVATIQPSQENLALFCCMMFNCATIGL